VQVADALMQQEQEKPAAIAGGGLALPGHRDKRATTVF
jgi:hypothetical protein